MKLLNGRGSSRQIALSFAIGVFIGVFPNFGRGLIFTSALAVVIRFSLPAAVLGGAISANPLVSPLTIAASYKLGKFMTGHRIRVNITDSEHIFAMSNFKNFGLNYLIGNFALSLGISVASYFAVKALTNECRKKHGKSEEGLDG